MARDQKPASERFLRSRTLCLVETLSDKSLKSELALYARKKRRQRLSTLIRLPDCAMCLCNGMAADAGPGSRFDIIPVSNDDIADLVDSGEVDFVLTNPASYAGLEYRYSVTRFARLRKGRKGGGSTQFGAVIIGFPENRRRSDQERGRGFGDPRDGSVHPGNRRHHGHRHHRRICLQRRHPVGTERHRLSIGHRVKKKKPAGSRPAGIAAGVAQRGVDLASAYGANFLRRIQAVGAFDGDR